MNNKLSIEELLQLIRKRFIILIFWMIGTLAVSAIFTFYVVDPTYQSTSKIVVNQMPSGSTTFTSSEINTNLSLIDTYQGIIMEPIILDKVVEETNLNETTDDLRDKIRFETEEMSLIFGISVIDKNPASAAELANTIAEVFQRQIGEILPVESVTILSQALPSRTPISPNVNLNLFFGMMLGFFIGLMQIFLSDLLDKRVKNDDIISDLGLLHLGTINEMPAKQVRESALPVQKESDQGIKRVIPRTINNYGMELEKHERKDEWRA